MSAYRICTRCIMDTTDREIEFDEHGHCNHCRFWHAVTSKDVLGPEEGRRKLDALVTQAKADGQGKKYDCILGLSGGVDSSYLALKARELGLRPLAIHLDNSWDAEIAVRNIERIVRTLDLDLITHVVEWREFRDLQRAYIKAGVVDIEVLTDHAITALAHRTAVEHGIRWVLSGTNHVSESIMPVTWTHRKSDLRNLKAIHKQFGERPMKTLPTLSMLRIQANERSQRVRPIAVLNYLPYHREEAMAELERELGWTYYGGKHHESLWTRFYQAHILPTKFGVDKRRAHLSALICSGQVQREDALKQLEAPIYSPKALGHDQDYVLKKLGFSEDEFARIMASPPKSHYDYPSDEAYIVPLMKVNRVLRKLKPSRG